MSKRARTSGALAIGLLLLAARNASAGPGGFTFTPPAGWIDISRGAPAAQRAKAPPALRAQADDSSMAFVAMDPEHWDDGFIENMNVVVQTDHGALPSTQEVLSQVTKAAAAEAAKSGFTYKPTRTEVVKVAGVTAGRVTADLTGPGVVAKQVQYMIPGEKAEAMLTYTAAPATFEQYAPLFEASAQATLGAVEPRPRSSMAESARLGAIAGAIGGAVGALLVMRSKRRRLLQQQQQAKPPG